MSSNFTIKQILKDHWHSFLSSYPNIRPVVVREVEKVLSCGEPSGGYAMYCCPHCGRYKFVPFRCHSRFCNTCGSAYQSDRAESIAAKLINCNHRHIVFTIPEDLRIYFRKDRSLLNVLFRSAAQVISDWLFSLNHKERLTAGMVCCLHTFGRDLKWNPHIHMLVTEGASGHSTIWKQIRFFPYTMLRKRWQTTLLFNLKTALDPDTFSLSAFKRLTDKFYSSYDNGFYVNAPSSSFNSTSAVANYITRYIGRPAMAQSRISGYDGTHVTFWYQPHGETELHRETVPAHEFIKKIIIHIPEKNFHMLRYYGLYARKHIHDAKFIKYLPSHQVKARRFFKRWAFRISKSFGYDPLKCTCGNFMEFVSLYFPFSPAHPPPFLW